MLHIIADLIADALLDSIKLIPFLFLTYLAMEYLEHRTGAQAQRLIRRSSGALATAGPKGTEPDGTESQASGQPATDQAGSGHPALGFLAPAVGGLLGAFPQCGFSAAASSLYAGRLITLGTLLAIYLSTSDEMLPILLSERAPVGMIFQLLLAKAAIGMAAGLAIDLLLRPKDMGHGHIHDICEQEHCHCEKGILRSALSHTLQIFLFILAVNLALNLILHFAGEDALANLLLGKPVLGPVLAGIMGLIPNCAGSVVITQLYLSGAMGTGAAMAGLLTGSGVGLLVLFRVNHDRKENLKILALLYGIGVLAGILVGIFVR